METSTTNINKDEDPAPPPRSSSAVFTIDFGEGRNVDLERHKSLVEKYQKRHRRGLSASKLEEKNKPVLSAATSSSTTPTAPKKSGFTRKSSSSVEGSSYDVSSSEDQRSDRASSIGPISPLTRKLSNKRERLSLPLKSAPGATERMVQSFTDYDLSSTSNNSISRTSRAARQSLKCIVKQLSSPECEMRKLAVKEDGNSLAQMIGGGATVASGGGGFVDGTEFDFDRRSDTVSEAGTYTIDTDLYTTEQKERMSIDRDFRMLDPVAGTLKVAEYVSQLAELNGNAANVGFDNNSGSFELAGAGQYGDFGVVVNGCSMEQMEIGGEEEEIEAFEGYISDENCGAVVVKLTGNMHQPQPTPSRQPQSNTRPKKPTTLLTNPQNIKPHLRNNDQRVKHHINNEQAHSKHTTDNRYGVTEFPNTKLSPILSPTQQQLMNEVVAAADVDDISKTFTKIMFPSPKARCNVEREENIVDQGSVISVTSSGAFRARNDLQRKSSLTKSDIYVEAYTDHQMELRIKQQSTPANTLSANLVHMTSTITSSNAAKVSNNLPPSVGGKTSPSKIPSPMGGGVGPYSRPRSRNCNNESDSSNSLETECYLKPTQHLLTQLEKRLEVKKHQQQQQQQQEQAPQVWNNDTTAAASYNLAKKPVHVRYNSLDDRNTQMISNKLEHFQRKNFCAIDQTNIAATGDVLVGNGYCGGATTHAVAHQYPLAPVTPASIVHRKVQNSPNNSPIRRSSSFSAKHQQPQQIVVNRLSGGQAVGHPKDVNNVRNSPIMSGARNTLQKSASTTNIKPLAAAAAGGAGQARRGSVTNSEAVSINANNSPYHHKIDRSKYGDTESSSSDDASQHQNLCAVSKRKDITSTRYNRAFSLRRGRLDDEQQQQLQHARCPNTPEMRRKFGGGGTSDRATSVDRKPTASKAHFHDIQPRYLQPSVTHTPHTPQLHTNPTQLNNNFPRNARHGSAPPGRRDSSHSHLDHAKQQQRLTSSAGTKSSSPFSRGEPGRFSMGRAGCGASKPMTNSQKTIRSGPNATGGNATPGSNRESSAAGPRTKQTVPRSNSSISSKEAEFENWKRRTTYDPMKAAAEGKKRADLAKKQLGNSMTQSYTEAMNPNSCDSSPSHSSSVHRSQSFHGTAVTSNTSTHHLHQRLLLSSGDEAEEDEDFEADDDDDDEDFTLSADEIGAGFSPPTPSPSHQHYPSPWQSEMQRQGSREEREGKNGAVVEGCLS